MSDNGGTRDPRLTGAIADVSKVTIPCDNGPYREGKGTNYEGGTRVVALASWPGHIKAGTTNNEILHVVDWYPTLAHLAGASTARCKTLDGIEMWKTISQGAPSPRTEVVYNIEPFRAAIRQGDWKLIWRTTLPSSVELYNIPKDPSEKLNLATQHPETVSLLQKRANELSAVASRPLFLLEGFQEIIKWGHLPPAFPNEEFDLANEP